MSYSPPKILTNGTNDLVIVVPFGFTIYKMISKVV